MNAPAKSKVSPAKIGMIVVLSLVFVGVLFAQFALPALSGEPGVAELRERPVPNDSESDSSPATQDSESVPIETDWPVMSIEDIVSHDPFHLPPALAKKDQSQSPTPDENPEEREQRSASADARESFEQAIRDLQVDQIVIGKNGKVAMIGSRRLRVGDIYQGMRVIEIHRDGIVVVPAEGDD